MTEEHKQHMRESALRRIAAMDEKKRTAFKEKCAANGRKSWAMRSAADKAAQIARINTPEVRKRASDANKAEHQAMTDEERAALSARHKARWLHPTESVEAVRQYAAYHLRGPCRSPRNGVRVCLATQRQIARTITHRICSAAVANRMSSGWERGA